MKVHLCDICIAEGKLRIAKYSTRDKRLRITLSYCTEHKPIIQKAKDVDSFYKLVVDADNGYNQLLAQA